MTEHQVVSHQQWLDARLALLAKEKALTHQHDALVRERLELPWVRVDKPYAFETPDGRKSLADLFGDKTQLMIYHFMFAPEWEQGCPSCSLVTETLNANYVHLSQRDVAFTLVSRAPLATLAPFKQRMGWTVPWVSSFDTDFNHDFGVSFTEAELKKNTYNFGTAPPYGGEEMQGLSSFYKDEDGTIYHTYSSYARGPESLMGIYAMLDMAPKGRDEDALPWPMAWVKHHDRYEAPQAEHACHTH